MSALSQHALEDLDLDEAARPQAPKIDGATADHLRRIEAGDAPPEDLRNIVLASDMGQNFRAFGSLCGQECKILTMHHDIEGADMFPRLEAAGGGVFADIVAKLRAEHEVVHELLVRLERAAMALMYDQTEETFADAAAIFRKLETVIRSHFKYEETELAEAIGYYLDGI